MHNILDIMDKQYIQDSTLLTVKKKFQFFYWFAFDSNINYIPPCEKEPSGHCKEINFEQYERV